MLGFINYCDFFSMTGYKCCPSKSLATFNVGLFNFSHSSESIVGKDLIKALICVGGDLCTKFEGDADGSIVGSLTNSKDSSVTVAGLLPFSRFYTKLTITYLPRRNFIYCYLEQTVSSSVRIV